MNRNNFIRTSLFSGLALTSLKSLGNLFSSNYNSKLPKMTLSEVMADVAPFALPALPYTTDALEPNIDKMTMEIHHGKHHKAYIDNLNKAVVGTPMEKMSLDEILKNVSKAPAVIRNNAGGHWNHTFFWQIMAAPMGAMPTGKLAEAINATFGSFDKMKEEFTKAAMTRFGSGWAWLMVSDGKLAIASTPNQDNPLMDIAEKKGTPLLALDVWEHAYYLKYQNKRADYVTAFWNVINWAKVSENFEKASK